MKQSQKPSGFALDFLTQLQTEVTSHTDIDLHKSGNTAMQRTDVDTSYMTPKVGRLTRYVAVRHATTNNRKGAPERLARYSAHFPQMGPVNAEELVRFAGIRPPELLFPFLRETLASLTASTAAGGI